jgi:hypothetical protein
MKKRRREEKRTRPERERVEVGEKRTGRKTERKRGFLKGAGGGG